MHEFKLRKHWQKPMTTDSDAEKNARDVEKAKVRRKQSFEE